MSKDRLSAEVFVQEFIRAHDKLTDSVELLGVSGVYAALTKLVDDRDRETRNMACSDLVSLVENLYVATTAEQNE